MSAFSSSSYTSDDYSKYRPRYPKSFFDYILGKSKVTSLQGKITILDVGCGPGTCFITMIPHLFELIKNEKCPVVEIELIASDLSATMLEQAKREIDSLLIKENNTSGVSVKYIQCKGEDIDKFVDADSVNLIISAEALHWVDAEVFLNAAHLVLKNGGTLAYWGYVDPVFMSVKGYKGDDTIVKKLNDVYEGFVYEEEGKLGAYWEQPGRGRLRNLYENINEIVEKDNNKQWVNVIKCTRDPLNGKVTKVGDVNVDALQMEMKLPLRAFLKYTDTWSSSFKWNQSHGDDEKVSEIFYKRITDIVPLGWEDEIVIEMKTVYMIANKI